MRMIHVAIVACALAVAGCGGLTRAPVVKGTFLLEPAPPAAAAATQPLTLRVGLVNVAAPYRGRSFVFRTDELKYETDYYDEFLVSPGSMIAEATARALSAAKVFRRVSAPGAAGADDDLVLDGFVSSLYGDTRTAGKSFAVIAVTYYLSGTDGRAGSVVWTHDYERRVPVSGSGAGDLVRAWNEGLSGILADLASDLAKSDLAPR